MGRTLKQISALLVVAAIGAAAAVASGGDRPHVDEVAATITFTHIKGKFRECEGQDGLYSENKIELTGTSVGDPRLTGAVEVEYWELFNFAVGFGPQEGRIVIRDPATGHKKAEGKFDNTGPFDFGQGTIVGRVSDEGSGADEEQLGSGTLVANWRILYVGGAITAQIGGAAADNLLPASIHAGGCRGKFEEFEGDLPAPDAVTAVSIANWRSPGR